MKKNQNDQLKERKGIEYREDTESKDTARKKTQFQTTLVHPAKILLY